MPFQTAAPPQNVSPATRPKRLLENLAPEYRVLFALASPGSSGQLPPDCDVETVDWDRLLRLAQAHGLLPLIHRNASDLRIPAEFRDHLTRAVRGATMRTLALSARLVEVLSMISRAGVRVLALKGLHQALSVYGDAQLRAYQDIDLFVDVADVPRVHALLVDSGYSIVDQSVVPTGADAVRFLALTQDNEYSYVSDTDGTHVELHWALLRPSFGTVVTFNEAWGERISVAFGKHSIDGLGNTHQLLYLAVHGAKHRWRRMEWIVGFATLAGKLTAEEWEQTWKLASRRHLDAVLRFALYLANELCVAVGQQQIRSFGDSWTPQRRLVEEAMSALQTEDLLDDYRNVAFYFDVRGNAGYRMACWIRHALMPSHRDFAALPPALRRQPYYWLIRPARLLSMGRKAWRWQNEVG